MIFISFLGKHSFLIPANLLFLAYFLFIKNKKWALGVAAVSLSSLGLMSLLKNLIQRQRPAEPIVDGITNFSFPSGHAFMSVAFYGLLAWWMATIIKNKRLRIIVIVFLLLLILLISFSRIYLRVHYATDSLAGLSLGTAWLILSLAIIDKWQGRDMDKRK
jgi:undecaprenyl-diphosphatase